MRFGKMGILAVAAVAAVGMASTSARATNVTYSTTGGFSANGGLPTLTVNGLTLTFTGGSGTVGVPTGASLGTFSLTGAPSTGGIFTSSFTLTVNQTAPNGGTGTFGTGTLSGVLVIDNTNVGHALATVDFVAPLTITIAGSPDVTYSIANHDDGVLGQVDLNAPGQTTTIQGAIVALPLPSAAMMGMGSLLALGVAGAIRKRVLA